MDTSTLLVDVKEFGITNVENWGCPSKWHENMAMRKHERDGREKMMMNWLNQSTAVIFGFVNIFYMCTASKAVVESTFTHVLCLSAVLRYLHMIICMLCYFDSSTFQREILYFLLHIYLTAGDTTTPKPLLLNIIVIDYRNYPTMCKIVTFSLIATVKFVSINNPLIYSIIIIPIGGNLFYFWHF